LEDNKEEDEYIPNPLADARMEAEREIAMFRSYPQDAALSTDAREVVDNKTPHAKLKILCTQVPSFPGWRGRL